MASGPKPNSQMAKTCKHFYTFFPLLLLSYVKTNCVEIKWDFQVKGVLDQSSARKARCFSPHLYFDLIIPLSCHIITCALATKHTHGKNSLSLIQSRIFDAYFHLYKGLKNIVLHAYYPSYIRTKRQKIYNTITQ